MNKTTGAFNSKKQKKSREVEQPKYQEEKKRFSFDLSSCLGDDVTQNVPGARETQLFLAQRRSLITWPLLLFMHCGT